MHVLVTKTVSRSSRVALTAIVLGRCDVTRASVLCSRFVKTSAHSQKHRFTAAGALTLVEELNSEERALLKDAITKKEKQLALKHGEPTIAKPDFDDLYKLSIHQSLPFIGFGFLDNLVMIVAGESIDSTIGASLCISTMAAAALGNTLSDIVGIGSAWYVEHWTAKLGVTPPTLTLEQLETRPCRIASYTGRALGVMIGCILGMFPLLFYENEKSDDAEEETDENETTAPKGAIKAASK